MTTEQNPGPADAGRRAAGTLGSTIAASAATITALVAVAIAVWDNVQTREHNRLSVMPYVVLQRVQRDSAGVNHGELTMSNEGVGPAILKELEIRLPIEGGRDTVLTAWGNAAPLIQRQGLQIRGWMDASSPAEVAGRGRQRQSPDAGLPGPPAAAAPLRLHLRRGKDRDAGGVVGCLARTG